MFIRAFNEGPYKVDGSSVFGPVPWSEWRQVVTPDRSMRITLQAFCLLVGTSMGWGLINTGIGFWHRSEDEMREKYSCPASRLLKGLKNYGISAREVRFVILTDLRFPHAGGCIRLDRAGNLVPVFKNAQYFVQEAAIREAVSKKDPRVSSWYPDGETTIAVLTEKAKVHALNGDAEIFPGLNVIRTDGPSRGHQVVIINDGGGRTIHPGSLFPTPHHTALQCIPNFDIDPTQSLRQKTVWRQEIIEDHMLVFFEGGDLGGVLGFHAGYLEVVRGESREEKVRIRQVNLVDAR